jgi:hypothetical protein
MTDTPRTDEDTCICGFKYNQHTYDKNCDSHGVCPDRQGVFRNQRQHDLIKSLERELAETKRDAERYRWIAENIDEFNRIQKENTGVEIEYAIDAAIKEQP